MLKKIYHKEHGETEMYEIDARSALANFPEEWAEEPWAKSKGSAKAAPVATGEEPKAPFEAKSKGSGWWAIFDAEGTQVGGNIRQPEAESFNGLSDDDKLEYVKAELAKS